jgi:hypothetical protein
MISANQEAIWGMSVNMDQPLGADHQEAQRGERFDNSRIGASDAVNAQSDSTHIRWNDLRSDLVQRTEAGFSQSCGMVLVGRYETWKQHLPHVGRTVWPPA